MLGRRGFVCMRSKSCVSVMLHLSVLFVECICGIAVEV